MGKAVWLLLNKKNSKIVHTSLTWKRIFWCREWLCCCCLRCCKIKFLLHQRTKTKKRMLILYFLSHRLWFKLNKRKSFCFYFWNIKTKSKKKKKFKKCSKFSFQLFYAVSCKHAHHRAPYSTRQIRPTCSSVKPRKRIR